MCLDSRFMHVVLQFLVFRIFPRDDPSTSKVPQGNGFTASAVGYTMFALASLLAPTIVGWRGARSSLFLVFSLSFFTFQVCHVLRRLLVHSIYRPATSSKVKKIRTKNKKSEPTRKKDNRNQQEQDLSEPTRKKDNLN